MDIKGLRERIKKLQDELANTKTKLAIEEERYKTILKTLEDEFQITAPEKIVETLEKMSAEKQLLEREVDAILVEIERVLKGDEQR